MEGSVVFVVGTQRKLRRLRRHCRPIGKLCKNWRGGLRNADFSAGRGGTDIDIGLINANIS